MTVIAKSLAALCLALTLAVLLSAMARFPELAQGAGGSITVVDTRQEVNYPSGVGLSVTVEAEAEIAEVRVYYRPAGSRRWGYAYPEFDPGTRIVATQSIPVRESTYMAPGADVEYFYEVRDVQGNVIRTDLATVEYLDQRFDWRRVNIGPLELVFHDIDDSRIGNATSALREDLRRVEELLQLEQPDSFKGVIYNSQADANAAFPVQSQTTTDHGTFAGYAFPEQGVFVGQGLDRRIIVHESAHMMLRDALGNRALQVPAWLNEGFATYTEPNVRVQGSNDLFRRTPPISAMKNLSGTPQSIPLFYRKSVSVVAHLIEEYGEDKFRRLLGELGAGRTIEEALVNVYGFDEHGLDASWARLPIPAPVENPRPLHLPEPTEAPDERSSGRTTATNSNADRQQEAVPPAIRSSPSNSALPEPRRKEPSPFVFIDSWMLAGVALLAAGAVAARFVYNRLRRKNEPAHDYWQDWDEPNQP